MSRATTVLRALDAVARDRPVVIESPGREERDDLLARVRHQLAGTGWRVIHVEGTAGIPGSPLQALVQAGLRLGQDGRGRGVADVVDQLVGDLRGERAVIVVREQHLLDGAAWGVLQAVRQRTGAALVLTRGSRAGSVDELDLPTSTVRLSAPTLSIGEFRDDLDDVLDLPLGALTAARLHAYVGGRVSLARAVVENASWDGDAIREGRGIADLQLSSEGLAPLLAPLVADLPADELQALELLALLGPTPSVEVMARVEGDVLERLERRGHLEEVVIEVAHVVVRPPALADHLRRTVPALRRRALLGEGAAGSLVPAGVGTAERTVRLLIESESQAVRRTSAAWQAQPSRDTAVELLHALDAAGQDREFHTVLTQSAGLAGSERALVRWQAVRWLHEASAHGRASSAVVGLRAAAKEVTRHGDHLRVLALRLDSATPVHARLREAERLARSDVHEPWVADSIWLAVARLQVAAADVEGARRTLGFLTRASAPAHAGDVHVVSSLLASLEGRGRDAVEHLDAGLAVALRLQDRDLLRRVVEAHLCSAYLGLAVPRLVEAAELGAALGMNVGAAGERYSAFVRLVLLHVCHGTDSPGPRAATRWGGAAGAEAGDGAGDDLVLGLLATWAELQARPTGGQAAIDDDVVRGLDELWDAGYRFGAMVAALAMFEVEHSPAIVERVERFAGAWDATAPRVHAANTVARAAGSVGGLLAAARGFEDAGFVHAAVRSIRRAALVAGKQGDQRTEQAATEELQRLRRELAGGPPDIPGPGVSALTEREREIAGMVAAGASNKQVAQALVLSVRTVETHVLRIMRKAGVEKRSNVRDFLLTQPESGRLL